MRVFELVQPNMDSFDDTDFLKEKFYSQASVQGTPNKVLTWHNVIWKINFKNLNLINQVLQFK